MNIEQLAGNPVASLAVGLLLALSVLGYIDVLLRLRSKGTTLGSKVAREIGVIFMFLLALAGLVLVIRGHVETLHADARTLGAVLFACSAIVVLAVGLWLRHLSPDP